jgi:hypothetical protein
MFASEKKKNLERKQSIDRISEETIIDSRTSSYLIPELKLFPGDQKEDHEEAMKQRVIDNLSISNHEDLLNQNEIYSKYNIDPYSNPKRCRSLEKMRCQRERKNSDDFAAPEFENTSETPIEHRRRHPLLGGLNSYSAKPRTSILNKNQTRESKTI